MGDRNLVKKVVVWRFISIFVTLLVMYIATGDVKSATGITLLLHVLLHVWQRIRVLRALNCDLVEPFERSRLHCVLVDQLLDLLRIQILLDP